MPDPNDNFRFLYVEDVDEIIREELPAELFLIDRFRRSSVSEAVGDNDSEPLWLKVGNLARPIKGARGEAVDKKESRPPRGGRRNVIAVSVAASNGTGLEFGCVHVEVRGWL